MKDAFHKVVAKVVEAHKVSYFADDAKVVVFLECANEDFIGLYIGIDDGRVAAKLDIVSFVVPAYVALRTLQSYVLYFGLCRIDGPFALFRCGISPADGPGLDTFAAFHLEGPEQIVASTVEVIT